MFKFWVFTLFFLQTQACDFNAFVKTFNKSYSDDIEYHHRETIFCNNFKLLEQHNSNPKSSYKVKMMSFHDLNDEERNLFLSKGYKQHNQHKQHKSYIKSLPQHRPSSRLNWFDQDKVLNIRDQGYCGDCWAESATAVLESFFNMTQLSVQQIAECTPQFENQGCEGGWPYLALDYALTTPLCTEKQYPTVIGNGVDQACNQTLINLTCTLRLPDRVRVAQLPTNDTKILNQSVSLGVVSIAIDAVIILVFMMDHLMVYRIAVN